MQTTIPLPIWEESSSIYPGKLIVICGFDGSGKTTQINLLRERLVSEGHDVLLTKQPTDKYRTNAYVRQYLHDGSDADPIEIAMLAAIDRRAHIRDIIVPALKSGKTVICDRYIYSSIAYFKERGVSERVIVNLNPFILKPDAAVFLYVDADVSLSRIIARDGVANKREEKDINSMRRVIETFSLLSVHDKYLTKFDASKSVKTVHDDICLFLKEIDLYSTDI